MIGGSRAYVDSMKRSWLPISVAIVAASSWSIAGPHDDGALGRTVRGRVTIPASFTARKVAVTARWQERHEAAQVAADGTFVLRGLPIDMDVAIEASSDRTDLSEPWLEGATTLSAGRDAGGVTVRLAPRVWGFAGNGWYCTHASSGPNECKRRPCNDCTRQRDAWSVIYLDHDVWVAKTAATADGCKRVKASLASTAGATQIGECTRVGDVLGPESAFNRSLLDPGDTWYCPRSGADTCSRSRSECARRSGGSCDAVDAVFAATSVNIAGKEGSSVHVYRDVAACVAGGSGVDADAYQLSACTKVGSIARAPVDPTVVPQGKGWYCYSRAEYGWCWRDRDLCEKSQTMESDPATKCAFVASAFVSQYRGDTSAFPTLTTCKAWVEELPASTRCEPTR
jgi:hypothetical protein